METTMKTIRIDVMKESGKWYTECTISVPAHVQDSWNALFIEQLKKIGYTNWMLLVHDETIDNGIPKIFMPGWEKDY